MNSIEKVPENGLISSSISSEEYRLIEMWIHRKSVHTQRYYSRHAVDFLLWIKKPIQLVTLEDMQGWVSMLAESVLEESTQAQTIESIKSLFSFAHEDMKLMANPSLFISPPKFKDCLVERILPEDDVKLMIRLEKNQRNQRFSQTYLQLSQEWVSAPLSFTQSPIVLQFTI
ncbi:MAG: phage integrase N-terminal SAM-like domain-containing protein [Oscillatoriophycideae cyanobacterium NC_groundwater_1537_Pr4_S-0.65um_50_18]|nr:phage integrase N-terminal SAM-like domain-containing protein [Candidatus Woesearchaeota archaeon]MBI4781660.1 phage integrase N-terminal SAM-like domain-containing protein [Oscillatoriophycideae cyanobacterium NC_groundwater_1537_Pr4_S-0.65um_50_18]